jgi:adenylate cyclase
VDPTERRLAVILAADVEGYSRLMGEDAPGTLERLMRRRAAIGGVVERHRGRIANTAGDSLLIEFGSALDAVECAAAIQGTEEAGEPPLRLRIGVHLGEVLVRNGDLFGDSVNVAARLEALSEPGAVVVSEAVHQQVRKQLAVSFEDLGPQALKNIAEPVRAYRLRPAGIPAATADPPALAPFDKPSIAVLPFLNISGDPEQEFFVDGLTEDIITALSRISALRVIARTSSFSYKGCATDIKRVAKELGVRYVMEGSVRRAGERLRVTAQLIETGTGHHVWAERYDRTVADLFDIQDEITCSVAASTETQVYLAEGALAVARPAANPTARDLLARAFEKTYSPRPEDLESATRLVDAALRIAPAEPRAHQLRAIVHALQLYYGLARHSAENVAQVQALARAALQLAPHDEMSHFAMSEAYGAAGQLDAALAACERGLEINPNSSILLGNLGAFLAALGRTEEAIAACRLALRLNPRDPGNFWRHINIAIAHFVAGEYAPALEEARKTTLSGAHLSSGILWAAAAAGLGKVEEASVALQHCLAARPGLRVGDVVPAIVTRFARDADHERLLELLRRAGLPD